MSRLFVPLLQVELPSPRSAFACTSSWERGAQHHTGPADPPARERLLALHTRRCGWKCDLGSARTLQGATDTHLRPSGTRADRPHGVRWTSRPATTWRLRCTRATAARTRATGTVCGWWSWGFTWKRCTRNRTGSTRPWTTCSTTRPCQVRVDFVEDDDVWARGCLRWRRWSMTIIIIIAAGTVAAYDTRNTSYWWYTYGLESGP